MDKDKLIGTRLDGRYELTELVGEGGMADVYRAVDVLDNRVVAVKILTIGWKIIPGSPTRLPNMISSFYPVFNTEAWSIPALLYITTIRCF